VAVLVDSAVGAGCRRHPLRAGGNGARRGIGDLEVTLNAPDQLGQVMTWIGQAVSQVSREV
jgi:hypothetical protein